MIDEPQCSIRRCKHLLGVTDAPEDRQVPFCRAFPIGIPTEISYGSNPHTEPFPGDHGIQYEPEDG